MTAEILPHTLNSRLGSVGIKKGTYHELSLYTWDAIPACTDTKCKANVICDFDRRGRCTVMIQYLKGTSVMLFKNFGEVLDEPTFYRIGMHLMPLYRILCRLKIEELGITDIVRTTDTGRKQANPIYKEIRDTIKLVDQLWVSLGLTQYCMVEMPNEPDFAPSDDYYSRVERGEVLTKEEEEALKKKGGRKRKLVRRKK